MCCKIYSAAWIAFFIVETLSVLPDYCNHLINGEDCGRPPTPVFSYYKPGSRCEIEVWKGCATFNRFNDEISCSDLCIGRLAKSYGEPITEEETVKPHPNVDNGIISVIKICGSEITLRKCQQNSSVIFTYNDETHICEEKTWYGCPTENKFHTKAACESMCKIEEDVDFEKEFDYIVDAAKDDIIEILDDVIEELDEPTTEVTEDTTTSTTETTETVTNTYPTGQISEYDIDAPDAPDR